MLCGDRAGPFFDLEFLAGHGAISADGYARLKQARPRPASSEWHRPASRAFLAASPVGAKRVGSQTRERPRLLTRRVQIRRGCAFGGVSARRA